MVHQHLHHQPGRVAPAARRDGRPVGPQADAARRPARLRNSECGGRPRHLVRDHARRAFPERRGRGDDHAGHPRRHHLDLSGRGAFQGDRRVDRCRRRWRHLGDVPVGCPGRPGELAVAVRPAGRACRRRHRRGAAIHPELARGARARVRRRRFAVVRGRGGRARLLPPRGPRTRLDRVRDAPESPRRRHRRCWFRGMGTAPTGSAPRRPAVPRARPFERFRVARDGLRRAGRDLRGPLPVLSGGARLVRPSLHPGAHADGAADDVRLRPRPAGGRAHRQSLDDGLRNLPGWRGAGPHGHLRLRRRRLPIHSARHARHGTRHGFDDDALHRGHHHRLAA